MIILIVVVLIVECMGATVFAILLLRVKYLKGELSGSIFELIKRKLRGGESFKKLHDTESPSIE
jgi:hypothetical protein